MNKHMTGRKGMKSQMACWASSLFRMFACGLAVLPWFLAVSDARSLFAVLAISANGFALLCLMAIFGVIGLLDVLVNDLAARRRLELTRTHRHFGLCALAFCYVAQVIVSHLHVRSTGMTLYLLWNALAILAFAFADASLRAKDDRHAHS